ILSDSEYRELLNTWRINSEHLVYGDLYRYKGNKAMHCLEYNLPSNLYIFNFPGYNGLPASISAGEKPYGYSVKNLSVVDRLLLNSCDSIVCDEYFEYTCIYTHEWQSLALPKYYGQ
ncbi:MAG: hypothetical protein ACRERS_06440, partial [Methylococcales bacterium]